MAPNPLLPPVERVKMDERRRLTVPKLMRDGLQWRDRIAAGSPAVFELVTPGRARLLSDVLLERLRDADEATIAGMSARLVVSTFENADARLALPIQVFEWVEGIHAKPTTVLVWASQHTVEFWSDDEWPRAVVRAALETSQFP